MLRAIAEATHIGAALEVFASSFPSASQRDPERKRDELQIERETLPSNIEEVVTELVATRNIPRGKDLSNPGESGPHQTTQVKAGNGLIWDLGPLLHLLFVHR